MSDNGEPRYLSIRAYGRLRKASEATIRFHIRKGAIVLHDGKVDVQQADLGWARRRHQSRGDPGAQTANARIRRARAKLEMARDQVAKLDEEYAERSEAVAQFEAEAAYVISALKDMAGQEAERVALDLGITPERAKRLLDDFTALCLDDLGDLRAQLVSTVDRV